MVLVVLPFVFFSLLDNGGLAALLELWYVPLMATIAASIPASGAPVAGGILFLPVLHSHGVCPRDAIAFSAITQFFGCGIFSPLNWLVIDPTVFLSSSLLASIVPSSVGLVLSLTVFKLSGCHGEHLVIASFACFCGVLAVYIIYGLMYGGMASSLKASSPMSVSSKLVLWSVPCCIGGMLTGYIGISIEKVLFVLLTLSGEGSVRQATVTSITLVGWVSGLSFLFHAFSPADPFAPGYIGAVPYHLWLVALPGILLGSILGPQINRLVGPRVILAVFAALLIYQSIHDMLDILHVNLFLDCRLISNLPLHCQPQVSRIAFNVSLT